jgi:UDPglucose 6-dehydrogenase
MEYKIAIIGLWHQGIVASACLSGLGYKVVGISSSKKFISDLSSCKLPIYEPGLTNLIRLGLKKKLLNFSTDYKQIKDVDFILVAHDIPVNNKDEIDLRFFFKDINLAIPFINKQITHITAQLPAGTCHKVKKLISKRLKMYNYIAYSPENLRLGTAIERYKNPYLPVIGTDNNYVFKKLKKLYSPFHKKWYKTDIISAEFLKHSLNTYLATSITLANEIGNLVYRMGGNGHEIARLLKLEPRIGNKALLTPGMGFSGGTLARDVKVLTNLSRINKLKSPLLNNLYISNKLQNSLPINIIKTIFDNKYRRGGGKILVLGLTYKPGTSTLRRSVSIDIIKKLKSRGFRVSSYDPKASMIEIKKLKNINYYKSLDKASQNVDLIVCITPWQEFLKIDFKKLKKKVKRNLFFDISGLFSKTFIEKRGFKYISLFHRNI